MIIIVGIKTNRQFAVPSYGTVFVWISCLCVLVYFFKAPELASASVKRALDICASGLIPSLFPFIVLVGIMNRSGLSIFISKLIGTPISKLWGIRKEAAYALFLGIVGGFPIGAVCVRELYESGEIEKEEAEGLLAAVNSASPAFCIGMLGINQLGSAKAGILLYLCQIAASLAVNHIGKTTPSHDVCTYRKPVSTPLPDILTEAVSTGGLTMLKICSFAVFFSVIGDAVCLAAENAAGIYASAFFASLFELTLAGKKASLLSDAASLIICAFAVGWSGFSVHMQTASVLSGSGLGLKRYFIKKLLQGILCALLVAAANYFWGS